MANGIPSGNNLASERTAPTDATRGEKERTRREFARRAALDRQRAEADIARFHFQTEERTRLHAEERRQPGQEFLELANG